MPSFDAVSEVDLQELTNAVDQASRVINTRFDFKGVDASFEREEHTVKVQAESEFQLTQMIDMLRGTLVRCKIDPMAMQIGDSVQSGKVVRQLVTLQNGIPIDTCKKIVKLIKETKSKVQTAIQGDQVRVSGKKRDDLQKVMALLRDAKLGMPVQFTNFRD